MRQHCFRCGLYWQGLTHDLSKFSPAEFIPGAKYYQGSRSPNNAQREAEGSSSAWLHHKGRNRHHHEYWNDLDLRTMQLEDGLGMPRKYIAEMICDRVAASKVYCGADYDQTKPWEHFERNRGFHNLAPETEELLEKCLALLRDEGEERLWQYIREEVLKK